MHPAGNQFANQPEAVSRAEASDSGTEATKVGYPEWS